VSSSAAIRQSVDEQGEVTDENVAFALAAAALALAAVGTGAADPPPPQHGAFDLEGHRGTRRLRPENTLGAFGKALQIGVTTLELDTGVTKDGVVVSHERRISPLECQGRGSARRSAT
jgi:glycerophosphoryl diester phosphodiesterase